MGFNISWIGFNGLSRKEALKRLKMTATSVIDEATEAPFSLAELPNRWLILFANDFDYADDARLALLSEGCTAIGCQIHEGVMHAGAVLYDKGKRVWSVKHDGYQNVYDLTVSGSPPADFEALRLHYIAEQKAEDAKDPGSVDQIFEIPCELARLACGYRHDFAQFDWGEPVFYVVEPTPADTSKHQASLLQRLLFSKV